MMRNPVMFVVEIGSVLTTLLFFRDLTDDGVDHLFVALVAAWLWFTVLFANFAEAIAEGRGKAQADTLRKTRTETVARVRADDGTIVEKAVERARPRRPVRRRGRRGHPRRRRDRRGHRQRRRVGHHRRVGPGDPRVRRRPVGGHGRHPGALRRDRRPHHPEARRGLHRPDDRPGRGGGAPEDARTRSRSTSCCPGSRIIFLLATVTLQPFAIYSGAEQQIVVLVALLVCLIPTTIGGLLSAIGIAGMDRMVQRNVLAMSGRAVEAAGDVSTLLLDKTGTITYGNRMAADLIPVDGDHRRRAGRGRAALEPGRRDARGPLDRRAHRARPRPATATGGSSRPSSSRSPRRPACRASTSSTTGSRRSVRKGAADSVIRWVDDQGGAAPPDLAADRGRHLDHRRHPAGGGRRRAGARRHPPQGHREAGHGRAVRRAPRPRHPHGDDHRRQPAHRQGHRRRGRGRRLHGRGHARGQDGPHPRGAGRREARRDDR